MYIYLFIYLFIYLSIYYNLQCCAILMYIRMAQSQKIWFCCIFRCGRVHKDHNSPKYSRQQLGTDDIESLHVRCGDMGAS